MSSSPTFALIASDLRLPSRPGGRDTKCMMVPRDPLRVLHWLRTLDAALSGTDDSSRRGTQELEGLQGSEVIVQWLEAGGYISGGRRKPPHARLVMPEGLMDVVSGFPDGIFRCPPDGYSREFQTVLHDLDEYDNSWDIFLSEDIQPSHPPTVTPLTVEWRGSGNFDIARTDASGRDLVSAAPLASGHLRWLRFLLEPSRETFEREMHHEWRTRGLDLLEALDEGLQPRTPDSRLPRLRPTWLTREDLKVHLTSDSPRRRALALRLLHDVERGVEEEVSRSADGPEGPRR